MQRTFAADASVSALRERQVRRWELEQQGVRPPADGDQARDGRGHGGDGGVLEGGGDERAIVASPTTPTTAAGVARRGRVRSRLVAMPRDPLDGGDARARWRAGSPEGNKHEEEGEGLWTQPTPSMPWEVRRLWGGRRLFHHAVRV